MIIFFNQTGYITNRPKIAFATEGDSFALFDEVSGELVLEKSTEDFGYDRLSGHRLKALNFSECETEGMFYLKVGGVRTRAFAVTTHPYTDVKRALMKEFYFQRCGSALLETYAGPYVHGACHTEKAVIPNESGAPTDKSLDVSGGWHDAGDYGRYIPSAAVALGHMLYAYELFPSKLDDKLNIPPGMFKVADFLNECRFELEWMLKMQSRDPANKGGFYHKVTAKKSCGMIMPDKDADELFLAPVSSVATAYACAIMLLAMRVFKKIDSKFARRLRDSAELAWRWLSANEFEPFINPPETDTRDYSVNSDADGRYWAAIEMYRFTRQDKYLDYARTLLTSISPVGFGWENPGGFGSLSYLKGVDFNVNDRLGSKLAELFLEEADTLVEKASQNAFGVTLSAEQFTLGSNSKILHNAIVLLIAFQVCIDQRRSIAYENAAMNQLHYLLGRNATGYSFVSGVGAKPVNFPHHRPSTADSIKQCVPGIVVGGPNFHLDDECAAELIKPDTPPSRCFIDDYRSYSTNENAIYRNSCAVFLAAYFD